MLFSPSGPSIPYSLRMALAPPPVSPLHFSMLQPHVLNQKRKACMFQSLHHHNRLMGQYTPVLNTVSSFWSPREDLSSGSSSSSSISPSSPLSSVDTPQNTPHLLIGQLNSLTFVTDLLGHLASPYVYYIY